VKRPKPKRSKTGSKKAAAAKRKDKYVLRLYVAGASARSRHAILRARELCANELEGQCTLEVIDVYQDPIRARDGQIVATPTLVKALPLPVRHLIGTLTNSSHLFVGLGLETPLKSRA
jgi:circadian clock protein KaiB